MNKPVPETAAEKFAEAAASPPFLYELCFEHTRKDAKAY